MDVVIDNFEWSEWKAARNLRKHGVSFEDALLAFRDENAILQRDRDEDGEARFHLIGAVSQITLLLVVHTFRDHHDEERIRIISARKATRRERQDYRQAISSRRSSL